MVMNRVTTYLHCAVSLYIQLTQDMKQQQRYERPKYMEGVHQHTVYFHGHRPTTTITQDYIYVSHSHNYYHGTISL